MSIQSEINRIKQKVLDSVRVALEKYRNVPTDLQNNYTSGTVSINELPSIIEGIEIGVFPEGNLNINTNGTTENVTNYATVSVTIPIYDGSVVDG